MATRSITQGNPAAGKDWGIAVPSVSADGRKLKAVHARLVTSAVVANRFVLLQVSDALGNVVFEVTTQTAIPASTTARVSAAAGIQPGAAITGAGFGVIHLLPLPTDLKLEPGWTIAVTTTAIDVGDQWSQVDYVLAD